MHKILSTHLFFYLFSFNCFIFQPVVCTLPAARHLRWLVFVFAFDSPVLDPVNIFPGRKKMQEQGARHPRNPMCVCLCVYVLSPQQSPENPSLSLRPRARVPEKAPQPHTAVPLASPSECPCVLSTERVEPVHHRFPGSVPRRLIQHGPDWLFMQSPCHLPPSKGLHSEPVPATAGKDRIPRGAVREPGEVVFAEHNGLTSQVSCVLGSLCDPS